DGAESARESQPAFLVHWNLGDATQLILDGILDGNDLVFVALNFGERGIQRGGLAAARGAGDQDHAVRLADVTPQPPDFPLRQPQYIQAQLAEFFMQRLLVEDA